MGLWVQLFFSNSDYWNFSICVSWLRSGFAHKWVLTKDQDLLINGQIGITVLEMWDVEF